MNARKTLSRLKALYSFYQYGEPVATFREAIVFLAVYLPVPLVLVLAVGMGWLVWPFLAVWPFVATILFCLYRERKTKKNEDRHE